MAHLGHPVLDAESVARSAEEVPPVPPVLRPVGELARLAN